MEKFNRFVMFFNFLVYRKIYCLFVILDRDFLFKFCNFKCCINDFLGNIIVIIVREKKNGLYKFIGEIIVGFLEIFYGKYLVI